MSNEPNLISSDSVKKAIDNILKELRLRKQFCISKELPFEIELSIDECPFQKSLEDAILKDGYVITKNDDNTKWFIKTDIYVVKEKFDSQIGELIMTRVKVQQL